MADGRRRTIDRCNMRDAGCGGRGAARLGHLSFDALLSLSCPNAVVVHPVRNGLLLAACENNVVINAIREL